MAELESRLQDMAPRKHHYVPKCYLKAWTGADGELCDYRRPNKDVVVKRCHPSATGWLDRLYTVENLAEPERDVIEEQFFQRVDQEAADALAYFLRNDPKLPERLQVGWARFLMSLMHRHPSQIDNLREMAAKAYDATADDFAAEYEKRKSPGDPRTYAEWRAATDEQAIAVLFARAFQSICDSGKIGKHLLGMKWQVVTYPHGERFITSDRPLLRAHKLENAEAILVLPISPRQVFVATNGEDATPALMRWTRGAPIKPFVNQLTARQAFRHVYGVCENHMALVSAHMGEGNGEPWRVHAGRPG